MWILIIVGVCFFLLGLGVHKLKWYFLISGYNTMSKNKKENVDVEGLGRLLGNYGYLGGGGFVLAGLMYGVGIKYVVELIIILFVIMTFYVLIKAQRYDGNMFSEDGKLRKGAGKQLVLPLGILIVSLLFVALVFFFSSKPTKITFLDEGVQFHGMYGSVYTWEDIVTVELMDELPTIESRTNGSALGSKLKGHFMTKELGYVKLFVNTSNPTCIYLETVGGEIIFNIGNEDKTKDIFREILNRIE